LEFYLTLIHRLTNQQTKTMNTTNLKQQISLSDLPNRAEQLGFVIDADVFTIGGFQVAKIALITPGKPTLPNMVFRSSRRSNSRSIVQKKINEHVIRKALLRVVELEDILIAS